jgi:hypothetical protein
VTSAGGFGFIFFHQCVGHYIFNPYTDGLQSTISVPFVLEMHDVEGVGAGALKLWMLHIVV